MYPAMQAGAIFFIVALFPVVAVGVALSVVRKRRQIARAQRAAYYSMPPSERAIVVKSILFMLRNGTASTKAVADALDLDNYTTDEALRRLHRHGFVVGGYHMGLLALYRQVQLTGNGLSFYDGYYGKVGDSFYVAPWGTVVSRSALFNSEVSPQVIDASGRATAWRA